MKKMIILLLFAMSVQVTWGQDDNSVAVSDSLAKKEARYATDSLKLTVRFLEDILHTVKDSITKAERKAEKIREYVWRGREMEELLARNFSRLHPENETMKTELVSSFHFIMQSLALYRSDLKENNDPQKEYSYLPQNIPKLVERLQYMTTYHKYTDWDKQKKIDELNGYLQDAYGNDAPIHFSLDGISSKEVKSVHWTEVKNMTVNRNKGEAGITTLSGREIKFNFTEEQYTYIASMHVNFLAFYEKMKD